MDLYASLLERTRVPQPSLQKFAVISIFSKLRSAPANHGPESQPGSDALTQCLCSSLPAVVDQSVRELCRLVVDSKLELSRGLVELQSALEGSDPKYVGVFVKGLGFLARVGFERSSGSWRFGSYENHPFVKILSSRAEVQSELVQQVMLFMVQNKQWGMVEVCQFLRPFLTFSVLRIPFLDYSSTLFVRQLVSSMASLCCSFPNESIPVFRLLISCLKYFPLRNIEETRNFNFIVECLADSFTVVSRHLVANESLVTEIQLCGMELLENVLSLCAFPQKLSGGLELIVELSKHFLSVQKDLALPYIPELSSIILSLSIILIDSELEHEQFSILKFLHFLLKWKSETEYVVESTPCALTEELLLIFPIINLMSSPSKSVKVAATDLLFILEKLLVKLLWSPKIELIKKEGYSSIGRPEYIIFRLLEHLWFQDQDSLSSSFFLNFASTVGTDFKEMQYRSMSWAYQLREYSLRIVERRKFSLPISQSQEMFLNKMPLLLGAIAGILVMHPSLGSDAIDSLTAIGTMDPKLGVPLLLAILFYNNIFTRKDVSCQHMLPKLLRMLPSLASQSVMIPLVVQTILPMLQKGGKPVLYATATRLLCQTWEINDRAFGSLQGFLLPEVFNEFMSETNISISMAASVRDVCRKDPDRGVDLILSVSACIEGQNPIVQALGFQSLAHLCEADVIDFYTAWDVITKHIRDCLVDPILAHSVCILLRWGAMDAEAYPEASKKVLKILWEVCSSKQLVNESQWAKARASAFEALVQYEVSYIEKSIPNFNQMSMDLLLSETNPDVLCAVEGLQVKIIAHEHMTRRRFVKEKKLPTSKIEKLLDVFPQVMFPSSGKRSNPGDLPGAALLCCSFTPRNVKNQGASREWQDVHSGYEDAMVQIAASLQLSRNIVIALLSLQSWKAFVRRWMRAVILSVEAKAPSVVLDKTPKAANDILKSMIRVAEDSIPRSAENIALAVGALCAVLPPSDHAIKASASKFLLSWLFQYEHEYRQWSAAISLGLVSSCLHVTDLKQKIQNVTALLEVLSISKSTLVKGACGIGLGYCCQKLLSRVEPTDNSNVNNHQSQEKELLGRIVRTLCLILRPVTRFSANTLESISGHFLASIDDRETIITSELTDENCDELEDDIWGIAGLILGLGSSVGAMYRSGAYDAVLKVKDLIVSWIPHVNSLVQNSGSSYEGSKVILSVGSCLVLPLVVAFCQRVEIMDNNELDRLVNGYEELISELLSVNKSGNFHKSLLMASSIGAGNLLACILHEGVHSIEVESVKCLLELFRKCYSTPYPPIIHLSGMLGVVNALGAGAGNLFELHSLSSSAPNGPDPKEHSHVLGPLLSNHVCVEHSTSLMQEIFLVAQNSDEHQLQQYAAWAVSFLRNQLWSKELLNVDNTMQTELSGSKSGSHSVSENSLVMKLAMWLKYLNYSGTGTIAHVCTVATIVRCLSRAPRLPSLDWGAIIRRCMRYEAQVTELLGPDSDFGKGKLREECLQFALVHGKHFDALLTFLDELTDLSRFRTLELSLQLCVLVHLADLVTLFSGSRLEKLFDDVADYLSSLTLNQIYNFKQKSLLRISCWKGLYQCLDEASLDSLEYIKNIERCMEVLFSLLPVPRSAAITGFDELNAVDEWSEAVRCLAKARHGWLLDFLQVSDVDPVQRDVHFIIVQKTIQAKAKLIRIGSIPLTELGRLKSYILNSEPIGIWNVLIEVVIALQQAEGSVKRQWLVDAVEISCVSSYPSTALQFLGLLSGSCCKYMPLLILDRLSVLNDLPVTLTSLLSEPSFEVVADTFVSYFWASTERIYSWASHVAAESGDDTPNIQPIDESENEMAAFLLRVMHYACVLLNDHLSLDKQIKLANMVLF